MIDRFRGWLHAWYQNYRVMRDPVARDILRGNTTGDDWVEVDRP